VELVSIALGCVEAGAVVPDLELGLI